MVPPSLLADLLVTVLRVDWETKAEILGLPDVDERTAKVKQVLQGLNPGVAPTGNNQERSVIARPNARKPTKQTPNPPISPGSGQSEDLQPLHRLLSERQEELSNAAKQAVTRELGRLTNIPPQSAEYSLVRTYVELLLNLPWKKVSEVDDNLDLEEARRRLEAEHEGLEAVKRRVVEYLAVYRLKKQLFLEDLEKNKKIPQEAPMDDETASDLIELIPDQDRRDALRSRPEEGVDEVPDNVYRDKGPILLLVGPPGVGKTSIARSLAESMGRKFHRISLGGVRDEAEIRGHRRTYVGALPGLLVQALRKVKVSNPLILLDELDKVGTSSYHGDPSAALLETLDPAQNWAFHDHYLGDVPIDLSQVLFVATANTLDTISAPLLDRCEVIECSGYVTDEKMAIAKRFLLPKQIKENGLNVDQVKVDDGALLRVITDYTREAGVRSLERELGKLCRSKAVEYSALRQNRAAEFDPLIRDADIERILGIARYDQDWREETYRPGVVTGMSYQGSGMGGILLIETILVPGGKGRLVMTGNLGEVISESAELALTLVKSRAVALNLVQKVDDDPLKGMDVHLHLPAGAVKKDGPSAGLGMVLAFVSLLSGRSMPATTSVTGEVTLRGRVTPVGGIKEKVLGAHRAGITRIIMPTRNRKDVEADLPDSVRNEIRFVYVSTIDEALEEVWGHDLWRAGGPKTEARL
ncbi:Lon protease C-terminal proteolytic domain-containing protein [Papiliotrema laurentii]|uniref:endopeptidase La n=1 Tax=Papiliotrema laurentii TaxID=5418 RepID=A0AAD9CZF0_PAPLA|nr:Lon protease C-terminal proteolytic domain-containing protein [Papiliotrema laurentii]